MIRCQLVCTIRLIICRYERWDTPEFYRPSEERQKVDREQKVKNDLAEKKREEWRLAYEKDKEEFYRKLNGT